MRPHHIKQIFDIFSGKDVVRRASRWRLVVFSWRRRGRRRRQLVDVVQDDDSGAFVFAGQPLERCMRRGMGAYRVVSPEGRNRCWRRSPRIMARWRCPPEVQVR